MLNNIVTATFVTNEHIMLDKMFWIMVKSTTKLRNAYQEYIVRSALSQKDTVIQYVCCWGTFDYGRYSIFAKI